jgi:hypothetical protein
VWWSVDLTDLALDTDTTAAADRLATIARALPAGRRVQVGAEDAAHSNAIVACVLDVATRGLADRLGATVQANRPTSRRSGAFRRHSGACGGRRFGGRWWFASSGSSVGRFGAVVRPPFEPWLTLDGGCMVFAL